MRSRYWWTGGTAAVCAAVFLPLALSQSGTDPSARSRDYVQFLVTELNQWTGDFPQAYNSALMKPPVDSSKLSEAAKAGADDLRANVKRLSELSKATDLMSNAEFKAQLAKTLEAAKAVNEALGAQRFPQSVEGDWVEIRTNLNSLADLYKASPLAVLEAPGPGRGRGRGGQQVAAALPPGAIAGYIVDQRCAKQGKAMWTNARCVQTCVQDGDPLVLVTEEGKVYRLLNQDKIETDYYGQKVAVTGKAEGDTITVASLQAL
jgi:hypothetical protein